MDNQPTDRQRLAAVLETLARVLRSEAEMRHSLPYEIDLALGDALESMRRGRVHLTFAENHATKAAKLAGVEVAKEKKL